MTQHSTGMTSSKYKQEKEQKVCEPREDFWAPVMLLFDGDNN